MASKNDKKAEKAAKDSKKAAKASRRARMGGGFFSKIKRYGLMVIVSIVFFMLLTGIINQRKTGESMLQYYYNYSVKTSHFFEGFFVGDNQKKMDMVGVHQTKDGVYLKGKDGSQGQAPDKPDATDNAPVVN